MSFRKVLCLLLAVTMVFVIVGCGKDDTKSPTSSSSKSEDEEDAVQVLRKGKIPLGPCYSECGPYQD